MGETDINIFIIFFNIIFLIFLSGIIIFIFQYRKRKILYEIHDSVGQKLTLASLYIQQLEFQNQFPVLHDKIAMVSIIINESLVQLRGLSRSLTDTETETGDIIPLLQQECERINAMNICQANVEYNQEAPVLTGMQKNIVFRILQEFLQNSLKHAACRVITIRILAYTHYILIEAMDDGRGFNMLPTGELQKGIGLLNMQKRAALLGAAFTMTSEPGKGTRLQLQLPQPSNDIPA